MSLSSHLLFYLLSSLYPVYHSKILSYLVEPSTGSTTTTMACSSCALFLMAMSVPYTLFLMTIGSLVTAFRSRWQPRKIPQSSTIQFRIMDLPTEIRCQIFAEICAPHRKLDFKGESGSWQWLPSSRKIPREIISYGVSAYYGSKRLIFEFPEFTLPPISKRRQVQWPSAIRIHDTDHELSFEIRPSLSPLQQQGVPKDSGVINISDFIRCPFYLFSGIIIQIPPYNDFASLIVNWCRLRWIGHILNRVDIWRKSMRKYSAEFYIEVPDRLTPIDIVFGDHRSWSWFDETGKPRSCPEFWSHFDCANDDDPPSDVMILLRALSSLKGSARLRVKGPAGFPQYELERKFSAAWLTDSSFEDYPGHANRRYLDPDFEQWLRECEREMYRQLRGMKLSRSSPCRPDDYLNLHFEVARPLPYLRAV